MEINSGLKILDSSNNGLHNTLGMEFISTPESDTIMARMPVDKRHTQPYGMLSGGATIALAETLAGLGSSILRPGSFPCGTNVSCCHVHTVREGGTVTAVGRIIHRSKKTHIWQVEVKDEQGELVSLISVTNLILEKKA